MITNSTNRHRIYLGVSARVRLSFLHGAANISAHTGARQVKIDGSKSDRKIFPRFAGYRAEVISNEGHRIPPPARGQRTV